MRSILFFDGVFPVEGAGFPSSLPPALGCVFKAYPKTFDDEVVRVSYVQFSSRRLDGFVAPLPPSFPSRSFFPELDP